MTHISVGKLTPLVQIMAWRQSGKCLNIVNWTLGNKVQWNQYRNSYILIQENAFENVFRTTAAILSRAQCVKVSNSWLLLNVRQTVHAALRRVLHTFDDTNKVYILPFSAGTSAVLTSIISMSTLNTQCRPILCNTTHLTVRSRIIVLQGHKLQFIDLWE